MLRSFVSLTVKTVLNPLIFDEVTEKKLVGFFLWPTEYISVLSPYFAHFVAHFISPHVA